MDEKLFKDLLSETDDDDAAFNMYLVVKGARPAYLIEFADHSKEKSENLVRIAKKLPHTRSRWERKGRNPRFLISNTRVSVSTFREALHDEDKLGKLLGFKCDTEWISGRYSASIVGTYHDHAAFIQTELCRSKLDAEQYKPTLQNMRSVAIPGMTFELIIRDNGYNNDEFVQFLKTANVRTLFKHKAQIRNSIANIVPNIEASFIWQQLYEHTPTFDTFSKFWKQHRVAILALAIFGDEEFAMSALKPEKQELFYANFEKLLLAYL
jgi:hypothetical protein